MLGTIINALAIVAGGLIGLTFKKRIKKSTADGIRPAMGIAIVLIGLYGVLTNALRITDGTLKSQGELLLLFSLVIGTLGGETLKIDERFSAWSRKIEHRFSVNGFSSAFVSGTLLYCVGAMAIIGPVNEVLASNNSVLMVKSTLDGISSIIFGATMGIGVVFSAIPVFLYQGGIALLALMFGDIISPSLLSDVCTVGYAIIIVIGINFLREKQIKTANMLPSLLIPILYHLIIHI